MGREFELKYRADPRTLEEIERAYAPFRVIAMETTYYDTPDGDLGSLRWTLRRRRENGTSVCTVKTALPDGSRGEWETGAEDIAGAVPALVRLGAPEALTAFAAKGLLPVCGASFTRRAALLAAGDGAVELALDSGVLLGGGRELPFAEVEVEQKRGSDEDTRRFARELAARFSLEAQPESKLARALALAAQSR